MVAFNFPNSPTVGQAYQGYTWDGEKWVTPGTTGGGGGSGGSGGGSSIYMSDTPPVGAAAGSMWYETDTGVMFANVADADSTQWVQVLGGTRGPTTKKNYIINGAMQISQENGAAASGANGYLPVDMFAVGSITGGTYSTAQVALMTPSGSPNRLRITVGTIDAAIAATDSLNISTKVEGLRAVDLRFGGEAKTVTARFGVKAPAGTYSFSIRTNTGSRSYITEYVISAAEANMDVVKIITIPGDNAGSWPIDSNPCLLVTWTLLAGSNLVGVPYTWSSFNYSASPSQSNFMGTTGNIFELFDVGLYEGTVAPAYVIPDYPEELALCQRYYVRTNAACVAIAAAAGHTFGSTCNWPVMMRASPTVSQPGVITASSNLSLFNVDQGTATGCRHFGTSTAAGQMTYHVIIVANVRM